MKAENEIPSAEAIFKSKYEAKTGKICDEAILHHMQYAIEAMKEHTKLHLTKQAEFIADRAKTFIGVNDEPMVSEGSILAASKEYQQSIK